MARQRVQKLFDPKLNVKDYSWKIGNLLKKIKLNQLPGYDTSIYTETTAFYNCRERGIALTLKCWNVKGFKQRPVFVIVFGEHRSSDSIFIDFWTQTTPPFNGPTTEDLTDEAYEHRLFVPYSDSMFEEAAFIITGMVVSWVHGDVHHVELPKELPVAVEALV